jgi:thiol-disulfide isomerase/thioredoxin
LNTQMFGPFRQAFVSAVALLVAAVTGAEVSAASSVLLAFSSQRCGHCQAMRPTLQQLETNGTAIRHVDVNAEPEFAQRHGIRQTPTYVVWSAGRELTRLVGTQPAEKIQAALAINPAGPLFQTEANVQRDSILNAPQTRLTAPGDPTPPQSRSEAMPSVSLADAVERARAATVRLRVHDGRGFGVGTGTIIDRHGEEALVLTCGHLFRETKHQSRIDVDLFIGGQIKTVPGQVIDYDADDRDIGLVVIRPGFDIAPVAVANPTVVPQSGLAVFSFGCDHGDDPSRRDTRITGVDKYNQHLGASNIEIAGAPVDGRSGGGLFDSAGQLIGVCNAADYKGDVGIYTGPGSVKWQLDRVQLSHLYQREPVLPNDLPRSPSPSAPQQPETLLASAGLPQGNQFTGGQMMVIVQDPNSPNGQRVITVARPTAELMEMIHRHAN